VRAEGQELTPALLETLFEEGPFGLAYLDRDLRYIRVSERLGAINGLAPEDHVGLTLEDVVPDLAPGVRHDVRRAILAGEVASHEITGETPAQPGVERTFLTSYYPVRSGGELVGAAIIVLEVSAERRMEEQRAQLYELERQARARAEAAERRAAFLAETAEMLDASLDLPTTLRTLSRVLVPRVADLCLIDMVGRGGAVRRVAVAHSDPEVEQLVWELTRRYPNAPSAPGGIRQVIEEGRTEYLLELDDELLERAFPDAEHRARVHALGLRSAVIVPLRARGRTLGAMTLLLTRPERVFDEPDIALAEELARRASLAVDNARLYTDLRRADQTRRFLSEATEILAGSLDWDTTVQTIAQLAVDGLADGCSIDALEPSGEIRELALAHVDEERRAIYAEFRRRYGVGRRSPFLRRAVQTMQPELHREVTDEQLRQAADDEEHFALLRAFNPRSIICVPLVARGRALGVISLYRTESGERFGEDDLNLAIELARRAAVAADNARLYSERTRVAETLQRSLVPASIPAIPHAEVAVRFRSAGEGEVGGDFYDVFERHPGSWAAVVGDVCGKGAQAAALTALARHTVRAAARYEDGPVGALEVLNDAITEQAPELLFCTAALLWLEPDADGAALRVALGGHLPPLLVRASGEVEALEAHGSLLGVFDQAELQERTAALRAGDAVVLYTDGVTEAGAPDAALGEERLSELVRGLAGRGAEEIAAAIERATLEHQSDRPRDDVAVLVLRYTG
jgi:PAS domain S-box-containing protein